ncbi:sugar-binding domain-containing protein [Pseudalkalibacillus hwajinpoensis]|uniref:glycoside hydrolase family 2 protein n=1 Tax=Guptibacillus hwajinpoensis TaxID=208199 RepID=UPI00325B1470
MRNQIMLSGQWDFKIDPLNKGETELWHKGIGESEKITVPHIWQQDEKYLDYKGAAWYQKQIDDVACSDAHDLYVCFQAVDYQADVWWNGKKIGSHEGGFTPFECKINKDLIEEKNSLIVRVYDPADNAEIPIGKQGSWYTRVSGIWQDVFLEERPELYISEVFLTPVLDEELVKLSFLLEGETNEQPVKGFQYSIHPHSLGLQEWSEGDRFSGTVLMEDVRKENNRVTCDIYVQGMKVWEPSQPYLYELEISLLDGSKDTSTTTFGFREIEQRKNKLYLNNEEIFVRGALDQAFYPDTIYMANSDEDIIKEIELAKKMGFNLLRKHIKVELPRYLYWADRLGMLIWAEPPNYVKWTPQARKRFIQGLQDMIRRDFNHPSIIIWSVYNEEWGLEWDLDFDKDKQAHVQQSYEQVKKWDPTRLVCDNSGWSHVQTDINDYHRYFVLPEQNNQWKKDVHTHIIGEPDKNFVPGFQSDNEPQIVSEFGVWGLPDVNKLKSFYNGAEPWWFVNQGEQTHQDDYKRPSTLFRNFDKFGISRAFQDYEKLAVLSQRRMFRATKALIEEMRKQSEMAGYVVTEFTDIEWETNGWLDFMREPKEGFENLIDFNGPNGIFAELPTHNYWQGDLISVDLFLLADLKKEETAQVKWSIIKENQQEVLSGEFQLLVSQKLTTHKKAIECKVPEIEKPEFFWLKLELFVNGVKVAKNDEELTFTPSLDMGNLNMLVDVKDEKFKNALIDAGFSHPQQDISTSSTIISDHLDNKVLQHAKNGGRVIFLAEEGDKIKEKSMFTFRELDLGESWARASSMNYVDKEWFGDLPLRTEMGWEFEGIFPDYVIPFTDYKKNHNNRTIHMFGNPAIAESADVISGYFQGWLGQNGGTLIEQKYGDGKILTTTWKIKESLSSSPIAQYILKTMINNLSWEKITVKE